MFLPHSIDPQDQAVKIAEAEELQKELRQIREENTDLKRQVGELSSVEAVAKKAEAKAEAIAEKVSTHLLVFFILGPYHLD